MEERVLNVALRSETGKGICRRLRKDGLIPGIVYGKGMESVPVTLNPKELSAVIAGAGGHNNLLTLKGGEGLDGQMVIVADVFIDFLRLTPRHVDLHKISMVDRIKVKVPVKLVGTPIGVKEGGLLDFSMHEVEVECLPGQIPAHIDVDVNNLTLGHSIHLADVVAPTGVKLLDDPRASVVSVLGKAREEVVAEA